MSKQAWVALGIALLVVGLVFTAVNLAGALGRISVLQEQATVAEGVRDAALEGEQAAIGAMNASFEEAADERVEAAIAIAEVTADLIVQEGQAEASFRRAESLAADNPVLEQAIQEMRGDAIVASMKADSVIATTAAALLTAQLRIGTLEGLNRDKDAEIFRTNAAWRAEVMIKDQIIAEQQNVIAPSFITKIFDMPEVALVGAVLGGGLVYMAVR